MAEVDLYIIRLKVSDYAEMIDLFFSNDVDDQLNATEMFRQWTSKYNPTVCRNLNSQTVQRLVEFLELDDNLALQEDAISILKNFTSDKFRKSGLVVEANAVPIFIKLLDSGNKNLQEQALLALGNIAVDCHTYRNDILFKGVMDPLLRLLTQEEMVKKAVRTLSKLCESSKFHPPFKHISRSVPILRNLLFHFDIDILSDACWTTSYLAKAYKIKIPKLFDVDVCKRLLELLMHDSGNVSIAALEAVHKIIAGSKCQTRVMVDFSLLASLLHLLSAPNRSVRNNCCRVIHTFITGDQTRIQEAIDAKIIPVLIDIFKEDQSKGIGNRDIVRMINAVVTDGSPDQINFLIDNGCILGLCNLLTAALTGVPRYELICLENILHFGENEFNKNDGINRFAAMVKECSGDEKILLLRCYDHNGIADIASSILENYLEDDNEIQHN